MRTRLSRWLATFARCCQAAPRAAFGETKVPAQRGLPALPTVQNGVQTGAQRPLHWRISTMDSPATYVHWGFIYISWPNLLVILGMIVLFAIAMIAPFPHSEGTDDVNAK